MDDSTLPLTVLEAVAEIERRAEKLLLATREALFSNPQKVIGILQASAAELLDEKAEYYRGVNEPAADRWLGKSARETVTDTGPDGLGGAEVVPGIANRDGGWRRRYGGPLRPA